jgi:hypothetical protein
VFVLLEFSSPSRRIFIGSHSLPPSLVRRIGPSDSTPTLPDLSRALLLRHTFGLDVEHWWLFCRPCLPFRRARCRWMHWWFRIPGSTPSTSNNPFRYAVPSRPCNRSSVVVSMKLHSPEMWFGGSSSISGDDNPSILWSSGAVYLATSPLLQTDTERGPPPGCKLFQSLCGHHQCWQCIFVSNFIWTCKRTSPLS